MRQALRQSKGILRAANLGSSSLPPRYTAAARRSANQPGRTTVRRCLSSNNTPSSTAHPVAPDVPDVPPTDPTEPPKAEDVSEPARTRTQRSAREAEVADLPTDLDILYIPGANPAKDPESFSRAIPPPHIFDEALNNLHISLHPQTQHRAAYASSGGRLIEPTLALYCPIEGGDYVIDATVTELARQTGAEVLVLDAVQLAAGDVGRFGKAANSLQLPRNPLHFTSLPAQSKGKPASTEDDGEDQLPAMFSGPMTLTVMTPTRLSGLLRSPSSSSRAAPPTKIKVFFDTLVNLSVQDDSPSHTRRPRIVYIRDFPTLAPSASSWYPTLLNAVRARRKGPLSRPSSPISNPMTIIFGITPPITPTVDSTPSPNNSAVNFLSNRSPSSQAVSAAKPAKIDFSESEIAERAREKRLRERLQKWEKGGYGVLDDLHRLMTSESAEDQPISPANVIVLGPNGQGNPEPPPSSPGDHPTPFFRTSTLVPSVRSVEDERASRINRRHEINELTIRMAVASAGGAIEKDSPSFECDSVPEAPLLVELAPHATSEPQHSSEAETQSSHQPPEAGSQPTRSPAQRMWEDWGDRVELWDNVRQIADHAVGSVVAASFASGELYKPTLEPTFVPWSIVQERWATLQVNASERKSWVQKALPTASKSEGNFETDSDETLKPDSRDELVERLRAEGELDPHETRLLSCIVDTASMPTSFNHVHLPSHTIDSVRTLVSLPLLHPEAFTRGILKSHGMAGCLLFGPPGTGKTLVVRALAKEAGSRMLVITPADVMDMYVGEGEKLVKAVFTLARRLSPCVIFLDEIDALFGARMPSRESGGAFAHRGVITEFMQEMDGLKTSRDDNVMVIGATNRPFDLDDAILRRLPRRLLVDLPGAKEREAILKIHLRDEVLADDLDLEGLAKRTHHFSGSDLKHLCVSAALDAVKEGVQVPWATPHPERGGADPVVEQQSPMGMGAHASDMEHNAKVPSRILRHANFEKALKEITPSSSETLGSLSDLRKWNEEFGEGRVGDRRRQIWGKDRFGFNEGVTHGT